MVAELRGRRVVERDDDGDAIAGLEIRVRATVHEARGNEAQAVARGLAVAAHPHVEARIAASGGAGRGITS